jgi:hypothetical protein
MNKNFKKVLDLIAEMKQSFATASMKFEQATLIDGTIVEFDVFEVGQPLFVVTETETIPAPEGTHALSGDLEGVSVVVDANGIIVEIIDERATEEEEVVVEEVVAEAMSTAKVESIINAKLESFASSIEAVAEMMKIIADQNNNLSKEVATLKGDFESFKSAPINTTSESEKFAKVGNLTAKQLWLKNNKNK